MTQSLDKALKLLEIITGRPDGIGLSELSRVSGIPKGTVHRLVRSLMRNGYVEQMNDTRYITGVKVAVLAHHLADTKPLNRFARPYMQELAEKTNETIILATLKDKSVVYLDEILTKQPVGTISKIGTTAPVHCTALGKAMLAFTDQAKLEAVLDNYEFKYYTENTITSRAAFLEELSLIKKRGYAVDNIEYEPDTRCVGTPIINDLKKVVAAVSISGPFFRVTEAKAQEYGRLLLDNARRIGRKLSLIH